MDHFTKSIKKWLRWRFNEKIFKLFTYISTNKRHPYSSFNSSADRWLAFDLESLYSCIRRILSSSSLRNLAASSAAFSASVLPLAKRFTMYYLKLLKLDCFLFYTYSIIWTIINSTFIAQDFSRSRQKRLDQNLSTKSSKSKNIFINRIHSSWTYLRIQMHFNSL